MNIAFRVDSSYAIGSGHAMRCLRLAQALKSRGHTSLFICRDHDGSVISKIADQNFPVITLPKVAQIKETDDSSGKLGNLYHSPWLGVSQERDAEECIDKLAGVTVDLLVVDHYGIDSQWETQIRNKYNAPIFVIDDLADRNHECEFLLDQNFYIDQESRYTSRVPKQCRQMLGPRFALLDPAFAAVRQNRLRMAETKNKELADKKTSLLIYFGAMDLGRNTLKAMQVIAENELRRQLDCHIILRESHEEFGQVCFLAESMSSAKVYPFVSDMPRLLAGIDISIGAGGTTTWERACLGIPSILMSVAHNQLKVCQDLAKMDLAVFLGEDNSITAAMIQEGLEKMVSQPAERIDMANRLMQICDGQGLERVAEILEEELKRWKK